MTGSIRHRCRYRDDDAGIWNKAVAWSLLPAHFVLVVIFSICLLRIVQNRQFLIDTYNTEDSIPLSRKGWLYQSDLTTLVSIVLTVTRTLAGSWLTLTGWRMAFMTLERGDTTLGTIDKLIRWRIPHFGWSRSRMSKPKSFAWDSTTFNTLSWLIFLLATPAQFTAPLLTGSITWNPSTFSRSLPSPIAITTAGPCTRWDWFNIYAHNREYDVYTAAGLASIAPATAFNASAPSTIRRNIPSILGNQVQSTLANVTMPLFSIRSLRWVTNLSQIGSDIDFVTASFLDGGSGTLNISSSLNPFYYSDHLGALTILNERPWEPEPYADNLNSSYMFPQPSVYLARRWLVLRFNRYDAVHPFNSCTDDSAFFGTPRQQDLDLYASPDYSGAASCFAIARIEFSAGSTICRACSIISEGVVEEDFQGHDPLPDPLAKTAISLMPEVLSYMSIMNVSSAPTWENLDGYTRGMLSVAYQASWNSVTNDIQPADPTFTTVSTTTAVLTAKVKKWKVFVWVTLNTLLTLSGAILALLQAKSQGKTIRNPGITALMLDAGGLIGIDDCGLCNAVEINKEDLRRRVRLVMSGGENYHHPLLVPDGLEEDSIRLIPLEVQQIHVNK